jgi:hypothetical protein
MKRGRKPGNPGTCAACGAVGHYKATCPEWEPTLRNSPSQLAAQLVIDTGCTGVEAAARFGVSPGSVHVAKQRLLRPRNGAR